MVFNLKNILTGALVVAGAFVASSAHAQLVNLPANSPFLGINLNGFAPAGAQIGALSSPFLQVSGAAVFTGTIHSAVYNNGVSNDFYYQVVMGPGANTNLLSLSLASFLGFTTDVGNINGVDIDGAGPFVVGGVSAPSAFRTFAGDGVGFNMLGAGVANGSTTTTLVVSTNANSFTLGSAGLLGGGGIASNANILAPLAVTTGAAPEPGTLILAGLGIAGLAARRRRKN